jgi:hypothetical protein
VVIRAFLDERLVDELTVSVASAILRMAIRCLPAPSRLTG